MKRVKAGYKLYVTVSPTTTEAWLTRQTARDNRPSNGILLEVPLTAFQQDRLQTIVDTLYEGVN